ncbi:MAG: DUF86 domain-containing protein [Staphylococcus sp.]|nr:DUF86 domain-containing protein [Staphylococcus sp.]
MREIIRDRERVRHMIEAIDQIQDARRRFSEHDLVNDPVIFYGLVKWVEVIGEAAYKITENTRCDWPDIPWKSIIGMRHVLVHGYYQIKPERLMATISEELPELREILAKLYARLS